MRGTVFRMRMHKKELHKIHKHVYESLAPVYQRRWKSFLCHQRRVLKTFIEMYSRDQRSSAIILDVGCGVGLDLFILHDAGFRVEGLDIASRMVTFAKKNVPNARVSTGNIMEMAISKKYNAIILDAFIHLFPKNDAPLLLRRIKKLLKPKGHIVISTTRSRRATEGFETKKDYPGMHVRYRAHWTKGELITLLRSEFGTALSYAEDRDPMRKSTWMTCIVQKAAG